MARIKDKTLIMKSLRLISHGTSSTEAQDRLEWADRFNIFSSATGDNRYFNTLAQFSPATDPRPERAMKSDDGGMGLMYKRMYDDNVTTLTLVPGVPEFMGILDYVANMVDGEAAIMANKGRAPGYAFYLGQAAGSVAFWPMQLASIAVTLMQFAFDTPGNSFYTLKRATGTHMMAAQGILNDIMVKLGYINPVLPIKEDSSYNQLSGRHPGDKEAINRDLQRLSSLFPGVINNDGSIDLMKMMMKGSRKYNYMINQIAKLDGDTSITSTDEKFIAIQDVIENLEMSSDVVQGSYSKEIVEKEIKSTGGFRDGKSKYEGSYTEKSSAFTRKAANQYVEGKPEGDLTPPPKAFDPESPTAEFKDAYDGDDKAGWFEDVKDLVSAVAHGGLQGITFRVDEDKGSVSDSFTNTSVDSPLKDKFNSASQAANTFKFDIGAGNTGVELVDGLLGVVKDSISGFASGSVIGNIPLALANNVNVKIPKHWESFSSSLHRESYTINCECTYAHPYEQVTKIWSVFSMILPFVAGFSTGGASHGAPLMVSAFCKSRTFIRNGMVESASFEFGNGDAGWTRDRKPLNMKVTLSIVDMDPVVSVPIKRGMSLFDVTNPAGVVKRLLTDDTNYNNYLARLTGMDYLDTTLRYNKLNQQLTQAKLSIQQSWSAQTFAATFSDSIFGDAAMLMSKQMAR